MVFSIFISIIAYIESLEAQLSFMMNKGKLLDQLFYICTWVFAFSVLIVMSCIFIGLLIGSFPSIKAFGFSFLWHFVWDANSNNFGAAAPLLGTLTTSFIAAALGIPLSFGIAVFLTQLCPHMFKPFLRTAIELLAGIPSIVYGIWGLFVFAPFFAIHIAPALNNYIGPIPYIGALVRGTSFGIGVLPAGIILAIMIIPFISSVMRDVFEIVPEPLTESAYALGASTWEVVWNIILPYSRIGVSGSIMLGLGRALGETMAVAFMIGNANRFNVSLLMPGSTLSSVLANEFSEATGKLYMSSLIELGLVLFLITCVVLAFSKLLLIRLAKREGLKH